MNTFYITTAIDYVNSVPHLGHAYEKIATDVFARFYRLKGHDTYFLTGTDEHGTKIEKEAKLANIPPQEFCDNITAKFIETWKNLNISYDDFIRTTQKRHCDAVIKIFNCLYANGDIYKDTYQGWYCSGCEAFLQEKDLVNNECPTHQRKAEWICEENYFFKISGYKAKIKQHILDNPDFIQPERRRHELLNLIEDFRDVSVSRQSVEWGIKVPIDESHTIYVWLDALSNYITALGYLSDNEEKFLKYWPANVQFIGKDILRFHTIIWPAMLLGLGLELPKTIYIHGFISWNSLKMSKSLGNVIDPNELVKKYPVDALRYYLLREFVFGNDGDFTIPSFEQRVDADLANNLGNSLNRILAILNKNLQGIIPDGDVDNEIAVLTQKVTDDVDNAMKKFAIQDALISIWELVNAINKYIDTQKPWALAKQVKENPEDKTAFKNFCDVFYTCLESLRVIAILLSSYLPDISTKIWEQLGIPEPLQNYKWHDIKVCKLKAGTKTNHKGPIFLRVGSELADKKKN